MESNDFEEFIFKVCDGNVDYVKRIIEKNPSFINKLSETNYQPIHYAGIKRNKFHLIINLF